MVTMLDDFYNYFKEGVIYHAFSDHSGITLYSTLSNEVFVAVVSVNDLISVFVKDVVDRKAFKDE